MDEGTIKTPIPKCRLYWCFCLGRCSNFVGSESGQKQSVKLLEYGLQHNPTPPPQPHFLYNLYCAFTLGRGEGWGRSERRQRGNISQEGSPVYKLQTTLVKTTFRVWCLYSSFVNVQDITRDWGLIRSTAGDVLESHGIISGRKRVPLKGNAQK